MLPNCTTSRELRGWDSNPRYRAYEARLVPTPDYPASRKGRIRTCVTVRMKDGRSLSGPLCATYKKNRFGTNPLRLEINIKYSAMHHLLHLCIPPSRMRYLGMMGHGKTNMLTAYALSTQIFISMLLFVIIIICLFLPGSSSLRFLSSIKYHDQEKMSFNL